MNPIRITKASEPVECKKCRKMFRDEEIWFLRFMGWFCGECALYVLAYWTINAVPATNKVMRDMTGADDEPSIIEGGE